MKINWKWIGTSLIVASIIALTLYFIFSSKDKKVSPEFPDITDDEITLKTVNYNVFGRWYDVTGYEGQDDHLRAIPEAIYSHPKLGPDVDVITIEEAWCPDSQIISGRVMCGENASRNILIESMKKYGWIYHTDVVDKPGESIIVKQTGGGAMIFSKWPILATSSFVYDTCAGQDCHAAKGAVYIRIIKTAASGIKQAFNFISTHLQAWSTPEGAKARAGQLNELHNKYLPAIGIPSNGTEPLLYQGDMNTDYVLYPEEVENMKDILKAELPPWVEGSSQLFSSDPSTNFLVGKDGAAAQDGCINEYENSLNVKPNQTGIVPAVPPLACTNIPTTTKSGKPFNKRFTDSNGKLNVGANCNAYCPCCPHEMLDYILYSTEPKYLQPVSSNIEIIPLKSVKPLTFKWGWCDGASCIIDKKEAHDITGSDLSDHYPVVANFLFKVKAKEFPMIDGCKNDNDCGLKVGGKYSCYCDGPTCTFNNKKVDGWICGGDNPVNKNCYYRSGWSKSCFCRPGNQ